jgi:hypothetical protein
MSLGNMSALVQQDWVDGQRAGWNDAGPKKGGKPVSSDVVGPVCESGDFFAKDRPLPKVAEGSPADDLRRALPALAKLLRTTHEFPQPWVLAVPREMPADQRAVALADLRDLRPQDVPLVEHAVGAPFDGTMPWVLFLDAQGVLRAAAAADDPKVHSDVHDWSRKFRRR